MKYGTSNICRILTVLSVLYNINPQPPRPQLTPAAQLQPCYVNLRWQTHLCDAHSRSYENRDIPDYDSIKEIKDELTSNAFTIQTNLGCGTVRYSRLTLNPAVFSNISITLLVAPPNPGVQAVIPVNSTAIQITSINRAFDTTQSVNQAYVTVGNALK